MYWCTILSLALCWIKLATSRKWLEGDIRLVGGPRRYMGTVVILHNGKWGAVCDYLWDMKDASVVCRQLGYTAALRTTTQSEFGPGRRKIWLLQVHCDGTEERLDECRLQIYNESVHKCSARNRSAGVICSASMQTLHNVENDKAPNKEGGKVTQVTAVKAEDILKDVKTLKNTGTLSRKQLQTSTETTITSLMLSTIVTTEQNTSVGSTFAVSSVTRNISQLEVSADLSLKHNYSKHFVLAKQNISSNESELSSEITIKDIKRNKMPPSDISPSLKGNILLSFSNVTSEDTMAQTNDQFLSDDPLVENLEIRLHGGRYEWEGHLQVRLGGKEWGTVCSDHWTLREAMVACNQLGEYGKAKQALMTSYFGGTDVPKIIYRILCVGRESTFSTCNMTLSDKEHVCSKNTAVAGVVCSHHLPDLVPNLRAVEDSIRLQDQPLYYLRCAMEENCLASSAYLIKNTTLAWRNKMRRLLRFSTVVHNRGQADFRPYRPRGQWEWHACHMHYHSMEIFAHYDILNAHGMRLAEGSKASFCLEDTTCDNGVHPQYNCRGFADQGLSVNCSDNYMYDIDCQWIDISDVKPGEYTFLMQVNPTMLVAESSFDNNIVSCRLFYTGYFATVKDCHYESLLDYKQEITKSIPQI